MSPTTALACAALMGGLLDPGRVIVEASAPLHAPAYGDLTCLPEPAGADAGKPVTEEAVPPGAVSWAAEGVPRRSILR